MVKHNAENKVENNALHLPQKQDGFALVAAVLIVAVMSVAAIPLLGLVDGSQESNVKGQVTSFLNVEAREQLELSIYLTKQAGGAPAGFEADDHDAASRELARACENRVERADPDLLGGTSRLTSLTNTQYSAISESDGRQTISFVVDKGKPLEQNDAGDDRYHRYVVVSCAIREGFGMAVYTSELANIKGSFYTLNLNEY